MTCDKVLSLEEFQARFQALKSVPKYDSSTETKLPHHWWGVDKPAIHTILGDISEKVTSCIPDTAGLDRELLHVRNTAVKLQTVGRSAPIKVALLGAQGAGKSLLINALFDCTGLSLTGAKGFACTSTIVKYAYDSRNKFSAEVRYMSTELRDRMIDEHIRSYRDYYNDMEDSDDEGGRRTRSLKQDELDRKRKQTAEDFFDTLFGSRDDFLNAYSSHPVDTEEFKSLCQLRCQDAMDEHETRFTKDSPAELLEKLRPFLSNVDGKVCLWPIVDCVIVRLNSALLKEGLEIIDLPGSGDVNMLRARHADAVRDSVDVEIVLGDTVRIGTDDVVSRTIRAGILSHGPSRVKLIATKIDVLSDDQISQCVGGIFDEIKKLLEIAEKDTSAADEEGDDAKVAQINRYKQYLSRRMKAEMISDRAKDISKKLGATLLQDGAIDIISTSTSDYMNWIKADKISFNNQPALSPEETGVPTVRRFMFNLPASQNTKGYINHVNVDVPAFVEKLKRVVTLDDRDADFHTIADDFDSFHKKILGGLLKAVNQTFTEYITMSVAKITRDKVAYKLAVKTLVQKRWLTLRSPAFTRLIKNRGSVLEGSSKAKGLENTVNWNAELAAIMRPGFEKWHYTHRTNLKLLEDALPLKLDRLYLEGEALIEKSPANLMTVAKSKQKWFRYRNTMKSKLKAMFTEMKVEEQRLLNRATLKDERENNLIAAITDNIFDEIFFSMPPLKGPPPAPGKPKRYITSVFSFRKNRLEANFLHEKDHYVDRMIGLFQEQLKEKMLGLVDKHFTKLTAMFNEFTTSLREHAPVDLPVDKMGKAMRCELEKHIPYIEEKAAALHLILPAMSAQDDNAGQLSGEDAHVMNGQTPDLNYFLEKVSKRKRNPQDNKAGNPLKKVKLEPGFD